jgi:LysM repeat protein
MISSKLAVSAAAIAAAAIGGQAAASAASAATAPGPHQAAAQAAHETATPAAFTRPALTADIARTYTVQPGDTLSGIASQAGISWQALYAANTSVVGSNPNMIFPGEVLALTGAGSQQPAQSGDANQQAAQSGQAAPQPGQGQPDQGQPGQGQPGQGQPGQGQPNAAAQQPATQSPAAASGGSAPASFQQCVIQAESGGDAQVMNSSGHYGLYQFSQSTWDEAGGNPADFGNASVAEQNQVFENAYAMWGTSPWAPYDGC